MRQRNWSRLALAGSAALLWTGMLNGVVIASELSGLTGDVEVDMPIAPGNGVAVIVDNPDGNGASSPNDVAQDASLPGITGWNIKDLRLAYDEGTDSMLVGVNMFGVAGDSDGDGMPGQLSSTVGRDEPSLGGLESIAVAIDTDLDGQPDVIAGVPANKPPGIEKGVDAFTVAKYQNSSHGLAFSFGGTLDEHMGELAFDPSAEHPDFLFTIEEFKELPGLVPEEGFTISAFAGSPADVIAGEDFLVNTRIAFPGSDNQQIPEPATVLAWSLVAGGALAYRLNARRAKR